MCLIDLISQTFTVMFYHFSFEATSRANVDHVSKMFHLILWSLILLTEIYVPHEACKWVSKIDYLLLLVP